MAKGGVFERDVCRFLSSWWCPDAPDVVFWRTAGSGGRATSRARAGKKTSAAHCGDVLAVDARGAALTSLVALELKKGYRRVRLFDLAAHAERAALPVVDCYATWIAQAETAARHAGAPWWWIVHGTDGQGPANALLTMPAGLFEHRALRAHRVAAPVIRLRVRDRWPGPGTISFVSVRLGAFVAAVSPDSIKDVYAADH